VTLIMAFLILLINKSSFLGTGYGVDRKRRMGDMLAG